MSEIAGLRAIVSNAGTLHGIHHEHLFTVRYYDADGFYAETAWYDEANPFWTGTTQATGGTLTQEAVDTMFERMRQLMDMPRDACSHIIPGVQVHAWQRAGVAAATCPWCGAAVAVPPARPPVPDVAVPPRHQPE